MAYYKKNYGGYYPQPKNYTGYNPQLPNSPMPKAIVKHSGAKLTRYFPKTGANAGVEQYLVTGWRLSRNKELISVRCVTTSKSKLSEKGWYGSVACTFTNTVTGETNFHWGTMHKATGKVVIDKLAVVLNPKAKNGGYCGTYINK